jgi:hypothetical protein
MFTVFKSSIITTNKNKTEIAPTYIIINNKPIKSCPNRIIEKLAVTNTKIKKNKE